jgi:hypothetical protein
MAAILLLIVSFATAAQVCPDYVNATQPQNCTSTCSVGKDTCPVGQKCCRRNANPCGFHCIEPEDNVERAGKCPTSSSSTDNPSWSICDAHFCDADKDCGGTEKCCLNICDSKICIAPQ